MESRNQHREGVRMGEFMTVADAAEIDESELAAFQVGGERIAVANVGGAFHAFNDTCTHLRCSLAEGELEGTVVTCPCHGSQFDVTTGEVLRGPAQEPVQSYAARVENQALQVEI
jgi:3-phenylpropionate/trans-cinnamate dioxygenase ferredoxin component